MPINIDDSLYWSAAELVRELNVSRQTLWRWRRRRKIPAGRRFRDGQIVFTEGEADSVREFAKKIEPFACQSATNHGPAMVHTSHS